MKIFEKFDFNPTDINLYYAAFTHTSYTNENPNYMNYERLEFLGDAVLELIISDYLYKERHLEEGTMTKMRASYVCENALATYATDLNFQEDIKLGSGESEPNNTILADVFEAFVAALYLDQGFEYTKKLVIDIIIKYIEKGIDFLQDYKSNLQELVQTVKKSVIYEIIDEKGSRDSRQRLFPHETPYDDAIRKVVKLLQDIPDQQRTGETENSHPHRTLRQVIPTLHS